MIRRLVLAALEEGLTAEPAWCEQHGLVYDLATGACTEGTFATVLPSRSSESIPVAGFLAEKSVNLQPDSRYRAAQVALADRWAAETGHALPQAVASLLRSGAAMPEDPRWLAFALDGKTCADVPELRALVARDAAPDTLPPEQCVACGEVAPVVRLHAGNAGMGNVAPALVSWDRKGIVTRGERRAGANLPTCTRCMFLYVQWLSKHTSYHRLTGCHSFVLDGQRWLLGNNVKAGFVVGVEPAAPDALLWEQMVTRQRLRWANEEKQMGLKPDLKAIDRVSAAPRDPCYQMGYLYGVLEWSAWVVGIPYPPLADVADAPALHLSALIVSCHDAADRYLAPTPGKGRPETGARPASRRDIVTTKLRQVLFWATEHVEALRVEPILPADRPAFALGYAHSLTKRGPRGDSLREEDAEINGNDPTPWAKRLAYALMDRGVVVETEYRVDYERDGKPRYVRIDVAVPGEKVAIEVDGRLEGFSTRDHTSDSRKCAVLLAKGWRVHRVPNKRLNLEDDIAEVADEVQAILASLRDASGAAPQD